jgi:hypothetical protein
MFARITSVYGALIRGLIVLATAGAITAVGMEKAAKTAGQSVRAGLISLKVLNARLGM